MSGVVVVYLNSIPPKMSQGGGAGREVDRSTTQRRPLLLLVVEFSRVLHAIVVFVFLILTNC